MSLNQSTEPKFGAGFLFDALTGRLHRRAGPGATQGSILCRSFRSVADLTHRTDRYASGLVGRIAQLARALPLHGRCRGFESLCAHHLPGVLPLVDSSPSADGATSVHSCSLHNDEATGDLGVVRFDATATGPPSYTSLAQTSDGLVYADSSRLGESRRCRPVTAQ